jgi:pilus assembly protein Flp/PilA
MVHSNTTHSVSQSIVKFWQDEEAATAVEYGLIAALIGAAIVTAVSGLGTSLTGLFNSVAGTINKKGV